MIFNALKAQSWPKGHAEGGVNRGMVGVPSKIFFETLDGIESEA